MLAVIKDQQDVLRAQRGRNALQRYGAPGEREAERGGDGDGDESWVGERREVGDPCAVCKSWRQATRYFQGKARLADAACTDERYQPMRAHQIHDLAHLGVASDQFGNALGKICSRTRGSDKALGCGRADFACKQVTASSNGANEVALFRKR